MTTEKEASATTARLSFEEKVITVLGATGLSLLISGVFWEQIMLSRLDHWLTTPEGGQHRLALSALVHVPADLMMVAGAGGMLVYTITLCGHSVLTSLRGLMKRSKKEG